MKSSNHIYVLWSVSCRTLLHFDLWNTLSTLMSTSHHLPHWQHFHQPMHACHFTSTWPLFRHPPLLDLLCRSTLDHRTHNLFHLPVHKPFWLYPNRSAFNLALFFSFGGAPKPVSAYANLPYTHLHQVGALCIYTLLALSMDIFTSKYLDDIMPSTFTNLHLFVSAQTCLLYL